MERTVIIIPARYASSRFPGKPLAMINGKPMIQWVYDRCASCPGISDVIIATDHDQIKKVAEDFGAKVCLTNEAHPSGTDRIYEAYQKMGLTHEIVINVQGDEPLVRQEQIQQLLTLFQKDQTQIATLVKQASETEIFDPNKVKVVLSAQGKALYFSRQCIPYQRGLEAQQWATNHNYLKHIGMYGFRASILKQLVSLPTSSLERAEQLEQLRWLEAGFSIQTAETPFETPAVDTPEDLNVLLHMLNT